MASVLVHEHDEHVRGLLAAQLVALGHVPLLDAARSDEGWGSEEIDVALIEPASLPGFRLAHELRVSRPDVPVVFASVKAPTDETRALAPVAHLVKPFRLGELAAALDVALVTPVATAS